MKNQATYARLRVSLTLTLAVLISAVTLVLGKATLVSAQTVYPSWSYTGNLNSGRAYPTTTLLSNGKVLVAGGLGGDNKSLSSAEVFDPATGMWSFTGNLNFGRSHHTATLLQNGKVLVAGGYPNPPTPVDVRNRAELYDPATGMWSNTGNLNFGRHDHTATLLQNGRVLVTGGSFGPNSELYDPATGTWSTTGSFNATNPATPTLLPNGKVLIEGGAYCDSEENCIPLRNAELYDPVTGTWSSTGNLNFGRNYHTATLLQNGKVLVAGGRGTCSTVECDLTSAELYDPVTGTWSNTGSLNSGRSFHTATLLSNGKVLVAGGFIDSAELYDPATGKWSITAYLNTPRRGSMATLLLNGKVLVVGGGVFSDDRTSELYDPSANPNSNLIDDAQFFAHQHYSDFLQRAPDAGGLAFWTNETASCGNDQQCIEVKRINVSAAFFLSIEFQETGYFVYRVNKAAHGNLPGAPVPVKLDEFLAETAEVGAGVIVGQPGWEQILESNKQFFLFDPDGDDRFTSTYPVSMTPGELVDALFSNAGITPLGTDRTAAINEFGSATTSADVAARARALRRVAENSTLAQQEFNRAFVLMQYFGYLRRNPNDPPEPTLDFQGYNFWLNKLNQFNGDFVQAEMVRAFIDSSEYRRRFGP